MNRKIGLLSGIFGLLLGCQTLQAVRTSPHRYQAHKILQRRADSDYQEAVEASYAAPATPDGVRIIPLLKLQQLHVNTDQKPEVLFDRFMSVVIALTHARIWTLVVDPLVKDLLCGGRELCQNDWLFKAAANVLANAVLQRLGAALESDTADECTQDLACTRLVTQHKLANVISLERLLANELSIRQTYFPVSVMVELIGQGSCGEFYLSPHLAGYDDQPWSIESKNGTVIREIGLLVVAKDQFKNRPQLVFVELDERRIESQRQCICVDLKGALRCQDISPKYRLSLACAILLALTSYSRA